MMPKPMKPIRSFMFVPGNRESWIDKCPASSADAVILDLEDGEVPDAGDRLARLSAWFLRTIFDALCRGGALLACRALTGATRIRPALAYYGVADAKSEDVRERSADTRVLFGGTVAAATGAPLLIEAIRQMRNGQDQWPRSIQVIVTGKGECLDEFNALSRQPGTPAVKVLGRLTDADYDDVMRKATVGLALKPNVGPLADSTFPSKVIEFASAGLLVMTTRISDVSKVLGPGGLYVDEDRPELIIEKLRWVVEHRSEAREIAKMGRVAVMAACAPATVGPMLFGLFFPDRGPSSR